MLWKVILLYLLKNLVEMLVHKTGVAVKMRVRMTFWFELLISAEVVTIFFFVNQYFDVS